MKIKLNLIFKYLFIIIFFMLFIAVFNTYSNVSYATEVNNEQENQFIYLSDIQYQSGKASGAIKLDQTDQGAKITLLYNGFAKSFDKGIWAHAPSEIIYNLSSEQYKDYDYFSTCYGVNTTSSGGDGVKFKFYTSSDGENWNLKKESEILKKANGFEYVRINIKDEKFLKLVVDKNGNNSYDHAVYADSKICKASYNEIDINGVKSVEKYDELIKDKYEKNGGVIDQELELYLLQRNLVNKAGQYNLKLFTDEDPKNKEALNWLMNNQEALKLWTVGGKPDGTYDKALRVLSKVYNAYKEDLNDETVFTNKFATVKAKDLYLKMMLSLSLTHSTDVYLWVDPSSKSDAVTRYKIYKYMHLAGKLNNDIFENLTVEEMRWVMNNIIDDEEIEWLNDLMKKRNLNDGHGAYQFITYRSGYQYNNSKYYDSNSDAYKVWDEKYDLKAHNITCASGHPRLWIVFEEGSVCGGLAKTWSNMRAVRGIPSSVVGQPGHAAAITYSVNNDGKGIWYLVNDVSGWANSGRTERIGIRMPNEWGEYNIATYTSNLKPDSYVILAQQAQNEYEKYESSEIVLLLEDVYKSDHQTLNNIYYKALEEEDINFDALYGLVMLYKNDTTFTEEQCFELAQRIATTYTYHPLPMYDLLRTLQSRFTSANYKARFATIQEQSLRKASIVNNANLALQSDVVRKVANTILGITDNTIATFSFDGNNAGKIILGSRFDGSEVRWDYSLNGGLEGEENWTATSEKSVTLTKEQLASITAENDIKIHIVGVNYNPENIFTIDIKKANPPTELYNNDWENKVIGATNTMEWKLADDDDWISFKSASPDLTGNKTVQVRVGPTGIYLPSDFVSLKYNEDNQPDTRKYISIWNEDGSKFLSVHGVSSEATNHNGHKEHAIDGNVYTYWHSDWNGNDKNRYIIIKLNEPKYISALEYRPKDGANGRIAKGEISLSMDGENWLPENTFTFTWANNDSLKSFDLEESIQAQYVRLKALTNYGDGRSFIAARMINLFEDKTGERPRATIEYSTTAPTAKPVIATLKLEDETTNITITNPADGSNQFIFKENGEFTFKFKNNDNQKTGTATARVNWMKNCEFSFDGDNKNKIVLSEKYAPNNADLENLIWEYSIDGGSSWITVEKTLEIELNETELESVKTNNNIKLKVHITQSAIGSDEYTVDITGGGSLPNDLYANDLENRVIGMTQEMEWRLKINEEEWGNWTLCKENIPVFDGNKTVEIRYSASGTTKEGPARTFTFTEDTVDSKKKYIPIKHLTVESFSTQTDREGNREYATNAIDGNINTMWHTKREIADPDRYIVIRLDEPKFISYLQYIVKPNYLFGILKDGNISVSLDGENWEKVLEIQGEKYTNVNQLTNKYVQEFNIEEPAYAKYIKLQCTQSYDYLQKADADYFVSAAMVNLFENIDQEYIDEIPPTVDISYNITEKTKEFVVATIRFSEPVEILTKNISLEQDSKDELTYTYTFKENLGFVLEFQDKSGNKGQSINVLVNWIEKEAPTVNITYSTTNLTNENVVATINCESPITIINNNGQKTYTFTQNGTAEFKYIIEDYLEGSAIANVNWIDKIAPTATVTYSTIQPTNQDVIATIRFSKDVTILKDIDLEKQEDGSYTYTFTENSGFCLEFQDQAGNIGKQELSVNYIDKVKPTATVTYSTIQPTNQNVIAIIRFNKDVTILNEDLIRQEDGSYTYTFSKNGEVSFNFIDEAGNIGTAKANVSWILNKIEPYIISNIYKIEPKYINEVKDKTTFGILVKNIETNQQISIIDNGKIITNESEIIKTGMLVKVNSTLQYTIIVKGDVNQDGYVDFKDILQINKHRLGKEKLEEINLMAGNVNYDEKLDFKDILQINKYRLGKANNL